MSAVRKRKVTQLQSTYMDSYKQQEQAVSNKRRGLMRRLMVFAVLVAITAYGIVTTIISQHEVLSEKQATKEKLQEQFDSLKDQQAVLEEEIVKLNDDDYIAKIIRRDYLLSKDGEIIFKVGDGS